MLIVVLITEADVVRELWKIFFCYIQRGAGGNQATMSGLDVWGVGGS